jgi:3-hydroxyisobutyrate dehydrogenase
MAETTRGLPRIGVIGLDPLGVAIAQRLADKCLVFVYDSSQPRREEAAYNKLATCETPWDLAVAADTVLINIRNGDEARNLIETGVVRGLAAGKRLLLLHAMDLIEVRKLGKSLEARGVTLIDALISGNETRARDGDLVLYVAGPKEEVRKCSVVFKLLGGSSKVMYCGSVGAAQILKAVELLATALGHAAFLEAIAFGENFGADAQHIRRALRASQSMNVSFGATLEKVLGAGPDAVKLHLRELPAIARAATLNKHPSPLADALLAFTSGGQRKVVEHGELVPSFWTEMKKMRGRNTKRLTKSDTRRMTKDDKKPD